MTSETFYVVRIGDEPPVDQPLRNETFGTQAQWEAGQKKHGPHNCWDFAEHRYDPGLQLGDYYVCGLDDLLLQVG